MVPCGWRKRLQALSTTVRRDASCLWSVKEICRTSLDLKYLRGIDLAIVPADALEYAREQRLFPGIEGSLSYIAKLYSQEFHLLARSDIKKIADLSGQTVNVDVQGSSTALTTTRLLNLLRLNVKIANDNQDAALRKLQNGEIAALAFVAAAPAPFFQAIDATDGLHLLSIPLTPAVASAYVAESDHELGIFPARHE